MSKNPKNKNNTSLNKEKFGKQKNTWVMLKKSKNKFLFCVILFEI